jgi:hypothetical protein
MIAITGTWISSVDQNYYTFNYDNTYSIGNLNGRRIFMFMAKNIIMIDEHFYQYSFSDSKILVILDLSRGDTITLTKL